MKKILFGLLLVSSLGLQAQKTDYDWKNMSPDQRKEIINNLSPEERKKLLAQFRNNVILDNLEIEAKDKAAFTVIFNEYMENQNKIKSQFDPTSNFDNLSDAEAKVKLQQSFEVGQQLLNNRKKYAEKMQEIVSPKKILKLFHWEGMMREKMNERKHGGNPNSAKEHRSK